MIVYEKFLYNHTHTHTHTHNGRLMDNVQECLLLNLVFFHFLLIVLKKMTITTTINIMGRM